jgi:3-phenylpropionate/trans-cinnamate dioxygenase ferredoxin reductase component
MQLAVIGAGQAACTLIAELVRGNFAGTILVFNGEGTPPYQRPPLSKTSLEQSLALDKMRLLPAKLAEDPRIQWIDAAVQSITPETGEVHIGTDAFTVDHIILATGTRAVRPEIEGLDANEIHVMRTWDDRIRLETAMQHATDVAIVGAGFMAFELAASLSHDDRTVHILARGARGLPQVSAESALFLTERSQAIVHTHCSVSGYDRATSTLNTSQGPVPAACVIATVGTTPNVELLAAHGLADADGIPVDPLMQTHHPRVSAIGEVCRHMHPSIGRPVRIESISEANDTASTLAKRLLGEPTPFRAIPWFWSDQGEHKLQIAGLADRGDAATVLQADDRRQVVARHRNGHVTSIEAINAATEFMAARRLFEQSAIELDLLLASGSVMALLQSSKS